MRARTRRGMLLPVLVAGLFTAVNAGSTATALDRTVTQSVNLTVPGGQVIELCASGTVEQCVRIATGPSSVAGTLSVEVSTPDVTAALAVAPCGTAGLTVTVGGATNGGRIKVTFLGTATPPGHKAKQVHITREVTGPSEQDTLTASLCLQRG